MTTTTQIDVRRAQHVHSAGWLVDWIGLDWVGGLIGLVVKQGQGRPEDPKSLSVKPAEHCCR